MKNAYIPALAAITLALALPSCHKSDKEEDTALPRIMVSTPVIEDSVVIYRQYPGAITANREVPLVCLVNGTLLQKNYESGGRVKQGDVLFRIDDHTYRDAVVQAEAALATAKANLEYAKTHYAAMAEALKGDAVSEMEVEQAKSTLATSEAAVKNAAATLSTARTRLGYCTITAPFDGMVSTNLFSDGAYISGEGSPATLATIFDDNTMTVTFAIDDAAADEILEEVKEGKLDLTAIPLIFDADLTHSYTGNFSYVAPKVNTSTGTLEFQAAIQNPYKELRSGMYVAVKLPVSNDAQALLVRDASIGADQLGKYVYVVNDSNKVVYTPITTGDLVSDSMRIVTKGLQPSDKYVTEALLKVRSGMEVTPISSDSTKH
ncbi:MAG: efflux RND transporter periplasmic adaptor subunit [Bacteroidales bacterium]|nr:efflux RND transporter periplasmic adaptor subunit [Bacteroidales bacterium]